MTQEGGLAEMIAERLSQESLISLEEQRAVYAEASKAYAASDFSHAADLFAGLTLTNPYETAYWSGLASCRQREKKYDEALNAWAMAALTDSSESAAPHYHAAECLFLLGDIEEMNKALELALTKAGDDEQLRKKITWLQYESSPDSRI